MDLWRRGGWRWRHCDCRGLNRLSWCKWRVSPAPAYASVQMKGLSGVVHLHGDMSDAMGTRRPSESPQRLLQHHYQTSQGSLFGHLPHLRTGWEGKSCSLGLRLVPNKEKTTFWKETMLFQEHSSAVLVIRSKLFFIEILAVFVSFYFGSLHEENLQPHNLMFFVLHRKSVKTKAFSAVQSKGKKTSEN